jgi:hypothetical protein
MPIYLPEAKMALLARKFSQKFVFERKSARKSTFLSKGFNFKRFKPGFLDSSK